MRKGLDFEADKGAYSVMVSGKGGGMRVSTAFLSSFFFGATLFELEAKEAS